MLALVEEVGAIRTAYLRAALVPEPARAGMRETLGQYVHARLQWTGAEMGDLAQSSARLHDRLWSLAVEEAGKNPNDVTALVVESANDVIRMHGERKLVRERSRIPGAVWIALYLISALSLAAMGYHGGVAGTTRSPVMVAVAITFSVILSVIADIDRPGEGWINVSQLPMVELRDEMAASRAD